MSAGERRAQSAARSLTKDEAEAFVLREAQLLDERRLEEWADLFTEDGYYWVPARPDQDNPHDEVSLFFDDREFMTTRIQRLRHPRLHSQDPPSRTLHVVSSVRIEDEALDDADVLVSSTMVMFEHRPKRGQRVFGARCHHALRFVGEDLKIAWKKVTLVNCDDSFEALLLPF